MAYDDGGLTALLRGAYRPSKQSDWKQTPFRHRERAFPKFELEF